MKRYWQCSKACGFLRDQISYVASQGLFVVYDVLTVAVVVAGRREDRTTEGGIMKEDQFPAFTSHKTLKSLLLPLPFFIRSTGAAQRISAGMT